MTRLEDEASNAPVPSGRRCKCGRDFSLTAVGDDGSPLSFAVIPDKDYLKFLELETEVLQARSDRDRLKAIARSAKYVGSLHQCPACSRLLLVKPGDGSADEGSTFYVRDV